jgi:hypothetical protein
MDGSIFHHGLTDWLGKALAEQVRREYAAIEEACEKALQSGHMGVLVVRSGGILKVAEPSPLVPYGHIYEGNLPSPQDVHEWIRDFAESREIPDFPIDQPPDLPD